MVFEGQFTTYTYPKATVFSRKKKRLLRIMELIGQVCVGLSLVSLLYIFSPVIAAQGVIAYHNTQKKIDALALGFLKPKENEKIPLSTPIPTPTPTPDPASLPFFIAIPKLNLHTQVMANVDPNNPDIYVPALKKGVGHGLGSAFPGQGKMVYIFGHSTDYAWNVTTYNALFYQLKDLETGDRIILYLGDKSFSYEVAEKVIAEPSEVELVNSQVDNDVLVLQTCYPPGTTWKRLNVIATPEQETGFGTIINYIP